MMPTQVFASAVERLAAVRAEIARACKDAARDPAEVTLVAVSKTFPAEAIEPVIAAGQRVFGENRVQEAKAKWPPLMAKHAGIALHLIGPLQSNKAKEAVALFDAIHSVDRASLCEALAKEIAKQGRQPTLFVEINTGAEPQKAGVLPQDADAFLSALPRELRLGNFRADVHSAARGGAGAAFRAHRQDRQAQWAQAFVHGHERGFCDRHTTRRHPCAGGQRDFRRAHMSATDPDFERWQARFAEPGYLFGTAPNAFLKAQAHLLRRGERALAIADGDGRNGVFLAEQGLDVLSVDFSPVAQAKALALAKERGVTLRVEQADMTNWRWPQADVRRGGGDLLPVHQSAGAGEDVCRHQAHAEVRRAAVAARATASSNSTTRPAGRPTRRSFIPARCCKRPSAIFHRSISANTRPTCRKAAGMPDDRR